MMKVFKLEVMVLDFEDSDIEVIKEILEQNRYLSATVMSHKSADIEWSDEHPLNESGTQARAYQDLFANN